MSASGESIAAIRHGLRTPLNHVLGYSEMLLEEAETAGTMEVLRDIHRLGRQLLASVQSLRPGEREGGAIDPDHFRVEIAGPVEDLVRKIGVLLEVASPENLTDVLRIASAGAELLNFARGSSRAAVPPGHVRPEIVSDGAAPASGTVLLIEDDEGNRDLLSRQLQHMGFRVVLAAGGEEGLTKLDCERVDIAVIDLMMPGMDGLDVLEAIKHSPQCQHVPVLIISALDELAGVRRCVERGADDYLFKPFDSVLLSARISAALERARLRQLEQKRTKELESIRDELQRSNEDLRSFAYAASHDLQAPLRTITTHLQLLERHVGPRLSQVDLDLIHFPVEAALRMSALIKDLLTYSQVSTDERVLEAVDCEELLAGTLRDLAVAIQESAATITHDRLPVLVAVQTELRQLFLNLIGNAIKYRGDAPPLIHIGSRRETAGWRFTVADNGVGIAPEHLDDIFHLFRRLHGHEKPGTGLGLAICKRILERIGGQIWVESRAGAGSRFHFTIPDAQYEASGEATGPQTSAVS